MVDDLGGHEQGGTNQGGTNQGRLRTWGERTRAGNELGWVVNLNVGGYIERPPWKDERQ